MQVYALQYAPVWEDKTASQTAMDAMIQHASPEPGSLLVLPELGDTGFSFALDRIVDDRSMTWAADVARRHGIWVQVGYAVRGDDGLGRNCATLVSPEGEAAGTYQKVHPFSYGREAEHFGGGSHLAIVRCGDALVAPLICYDLRFPELWRHAALAGAEILAMGASWPDARQHHWRALAVARAIENQAYVVAVNRCGPDPHHAYAGGSLVVSPMGEILAEAGDAPVVLTASLDLPALRAWRAAFPVLRDIRRELLGSIACTGASPVDQR